MELPVLESLRPCPHRVQSPAFLSYGVPTIWCGASSFTGGGEPVRKPAAFCAVCPPEVCGSPVAKRPRPGRCIHLGEILERVPSKCPLIGEVAVRACAVHGRCVTRGEYLQDAAAACCEGCGQRRDA